MLQLTLESGQVVQRVFAGFISSQGDLEKATKEIASEVKDNHTDKPLLVEIWRDVTPKPCSECGRRKKLSENGSAVHLVRQVPRT